MTVLPLSHQRIRTTEQEGLPCLSHPSDGLASRDTFSGRAPVSHDLLLGNMAAVVLLSLD